MRKIICVIFAGLIAFTLCACSQDKQSEMYIKPTEFSKETVEVLDLFDDEIRFFDISIDETVNSHTISVWVYRDGEWIEDGKIFGNIDHLSERIALRLTKTSFDLYTIDESGHGKCSYPVLDTPFEESMAIGSTRIDREIPLELNKETPIWVKIGTTENGMMGMDITDNFRNAECNAGIAITLTVSDEIME